jgi:hypothetical protein
LVLKKKYTTKAAAAQRRCPALASTLKLFAGDGTRAKMQLKEEV